jgi:hypothetical protein
LIAKIFWNWETVSDCLNRADCGTDTQRFVRGILKSSAIVAQTARQIQGHHLGGMRIQEDQEDDSKATYPERNGAPGEAEHAVHL